MPSVTLAEGAEDNGFASMLLTMLQQNLEDHPKKRDVLSRMRGRVCLVVEDLKIVLTLVFEHGRLVIHDGMTGIPDVTVRASSELHMKMSLIEIGRFGLPDPKGEVTKEIAQASSSGEIVVQGLLANVPLMARLTRVMSVQGNP